ncbi:MAG: hypothetical protein GWO38_19640 [Phycisphaerae bacterium]|nr:hypothetical protein [Phycisphaerae bacterium]NIX29781.1 hypothetical protein [Phycisphaerae bacterium]
MYLYSDPNEGKARFNELLQEAEAERRYQRIKGNRPSLLQRSGDFLISLGQQLKAQAQSNPTIPALQKK